MKQVILSLLLIGILNCFLSQFAVAQTAASPTPAVTAPTPTATPSVQAAAPDSSADFLTQVMSAIKGFGGLSTLMKVTTIIMLLIASMKVSFLNSLVWSKLGAYQSMVAPFLGIVAGALGLFGGSAPVTIASVFAYFLSGVGAVGLHELLDDIKAIPGIGSAYVTVIGAIEGILGGPKPTTTTTT